MKYLIPLNQETLDLAKKEIEIVSEDPSIQFDEHVAIVETECDHLHMTLALSHEVWEYIGEINLQTIKNKQEILEKIETLPWSTLPGQTFLFKYFSKDKKHKDHELSTIFIGKSIKKALNAHKPFDVETKNPDNLITATCTDTHIYLGRFLHKIDKSYQERKPHMRILPKPVSLAPRTAKVMSNLLHANEGETIIDPCCGTGGLLIEAGLLGKIVLGVDIDPEMVDISKKNLKHYQVKEYEVICQDIFSYDKKHPFLATDLPYFKNTKGTGSLEIYERFINKFLTMATKRIVLCCKEDNEIDSIIKENIQKSNWKLTDQFIIYIHKSMNRKIYIINMF